MPRSKYPDGLPAASTPYDVLVRRVSATMDERQINQTEVCRALSLSPVYLSLWLRQREGISMLQRGLYSAALEPWVGDASFTLDDPQLTNTKASQVPPPRAAGTAPPPPKRKALAESDPPSPAAGTLAAGREKRAKLSAASLPPSLGGEREAKAAAPAAPAPPVAPDAAASATLKRQLLQSVRAIKKADTHRLLSAPSAAAPQSGTADDAPPTAVPPPPPSLEALLLRLYAGGYATAAAFCFDFDALLAAAVA